MSQERQVDADKMGSDSLHHPQRIYRAKLLKLVIPLSLLAIGLPIIIYKLASPFFVTREHKLFENLERAHPDCDHYDLQQEVPQFGQHLLCIKENPGSYDSVFVSLIRDSLLNQEEIHQFSTNPSGKRKDIGDFYEYLREKLGSKERAIEFWRTFDSDGNELKTIDTLIVKKSFILYTGGTFMWPGIRAGHRRKTQEGYMMETLSLRPLVFRIENFLTDEECDYARIQSEKSLTFSVAREQNSLDGIVTDEKKPEITWRTSLQTFLESHNRPKLQVIDNRVASLTKTSVLLQEDAQVMRYLRDQFYDNHHDYFDPKYYKDDPGFLIQLKDGRNRLATVLWYLSTVKTGDGGHTIFPLANGNTRGPFNVRSCEPQNSMKIQPRRRDVLLFYNLYADRSLDKSSLHGACPVTGGSPKWAANKWIWTDDPEDYSF